MGLTRRGFLSGLAWPLAPRAQSSEVPVAEVFQEDNWTHIVDIGGLIAVFEFPVDSGLIAFRGDASVGLSLAANGPLQVGSWPTPMQILPAHAPTSSGSYTAWSFGTGTAPFDVSGLDAPPAPSEDGSNPCATQGAVDAYNAAQAAFEDYLTANAGADAFVSTFSTLPPWPNDGDAELVSRGDSEGLFVETENIPADEDNPVAHCDPTGISWDISGSDPSSKANWFMFDSTVGPPVQVSYLIALNSAEVPWSVAPVAYLANVSRLLTNYPNVDPTIKEVKFNLLTTSPGDNEYMNDDGTHSLPSEIIDDPVVVTVSLYNAGQLAVAGGAVVKTGIPLAVATTATRIFASLFKVVTIHQQLDGHWAIAFTDPP